MFSLKSVSEGSLERIINGEKQPIILKLLDYKKLHGETSDEYELVVFDGLKQYEYTKLSTNLNHLFESGIFNKNVFFKVLNYEVLDEKGRKMLIILDVKVLISDEKVLIPKQEETIQNISKNLTKMEIENKAKTNDTVSIKELSRDTKKPIKAKVTYISQIYDWSNTEEKGKRFSGCLEDDSGKIRFVAFDNSCTNLDSAYNRIELNKIHYISDYHLYRPKREFLLKDGSEYEISITEKTTFMVDIKKNED